MKRHSLWCRDSLPRGSSSLGPVSACSFESVMGPGYKLTVNVGAVTEQVDCRFIATDSGVPVRTLVESSRQ